MVTRDRRSGQENKHGEIYIGDAACAVRGLLTATTVAIQTSPDCQTHAADTESAHIPMRIGQDEIDERI
jgi:hypothetical protein